MQKQELPGTERLTFRPLCADDRDMLRGILGDAQTMYAWGYAFSDEQIDAWIAANAARYANGGFGYCAALARHTGACVGMLGILQETVHGETVPGLGYILARAHWGKGYATEGARAFLRHAFVHHSAARVIAEIRPENTASCRVAQALGMAVCGQLVKHHNGQDMPHVIYEITRAAWESATASAATGADAGANATASSAQARQK